MTLSCTELQSHFLPWTLSPSDTTSWGFWAHGSQCPHHRQWLQQGRPLSSPRSEGHEQEGGKVGQKELDRHMMWHSRGNLCRSPWPSSWRKEHICAVRSPQLHTPCDEARDTELTHTQAAPQRAIYLTLTYLLIQNADSQAPPRTNCVRSSG